MTQLVGIFCTNGVVIATDSAATFSAGRAPTIGQQLVQKIYFPCESIIYAGTGAVGIAQLISGELRDKWAAGAYKNLAQPDQVMRLVGQHIAALVAPHLQLAAIQQQLVGEAGASLTKSMVAFPVKGKPQLFTFDFNGAPEMASDKLPFVALGSGQPIADPFLAFLGRLLWPDRQPTLAEGRLAAAWTVDHVRRTNPGGVGGATCMAILEPGATNLPKVRKIEENELAEHQERFRSAELAIKNELSPPHLDAEVKDLPPPPAPA